MNVDGASNMKRLMIAALAWVGLVSVDARA